MSEIIDSTYKIIKQIGAGGGGNVFLAEHLRLEKKVVLKADKRKLSTRPELLRREVDILKNLSHPYIPQVYDFFYEDGTVYTVMEFIEGESLDKPLQRGEKFSQPQVIKWAKQLLDALCYLHSPTHGDPPRGFVHSDIKPANLMRTPQNDIYLIDFNIALALGEENVVGCTAGYASPEHYGLDFSSLSGDTITNTNSSTKTVTILEQTETLTLSNSGSSSPSKKIVPDVRSDIYSVGATLYHLLSGVKPPKNAMAVPPLSEKEFSPQIVKIISKAMNPNPNLRYQTANEMLDDLSHLHANDVRTRRLKRDNIIAGVLIGVFLCLGVATTFVGLQRMQVVENWLKLSEYSQTALSKGDSNQALDYALQAIPGNSNPFLPDCLPEAQKALTDALGIYDLSDGFKKYKILELPSTPLGLKISPDGKTAACVYSGSVAVFDTENAAILNTLPADVSALSEVEYLDENTIIYAGQGGIVAFDISKGQTIWAGEPATAISISQDKHTVAAVYKDQNFAIVYDTFSGKIKKRLNFGNKHQSVAVNTTFANPEDNLFALNSDGTMLAISFSDGSLMVYNLQNAENNIEIWDQNSGFTHFEGGFYGEYLAFSGTNTSNSAFAIVDTVQKKQTGGFDSEGYFGVQTDENGIYVQMKNLLVKIDPVTGEQTPLITTPETVQHFDVGNTHTAVLSKENLMLFDSTARLTSSFEESEPSDFIQIAGDVVLVANRNAPSIRILKYEKHEDAEVFSYDSAYKHDEARISADGKTVMLFSYKQFRVYETSGAMICEVDIPNAQQVYDQQFIREGKKSYLEVTYHDGTQVRYSAADGTVIGKETTTPPDKSLDEEFYTDKLRIDSPLHGFPSVYDKESGEFICELKEDAYLTYITQVGEYIIAQYMTTDGDFYGILMNDQCKTIARLPRLCDVYGDQLYFDYSTGNMRKSRIYQIEELVSMAQDEIK